VASAGSRPIDRRSPVPLWAQLEADLRRRIAAGSFRDRFPTDEELVGHYEVSRHTVREAVRRLSEDGTVVRERGRGTTLAAGRLDRPLGRLYSLFEAVEAGGIDQRSEVIDERETTSAEVAARLGLDRDEPLVLVVRLRRAGDEPLAVDRVWLPASAGAPLLGTDWSHTSLYDQLAQHGGRRPDSGWERIRAVDPPAADRKRLQLPEGAAAFCIERLGVVDDEPVEYRRSMVRGDRFAFLTEWSADRSASELHLTAGDADTVPPSANGR
jgi:GntR family transcriptional regulator